MNGPQYYYPAGGSGADHPSQRMQNRTGAVTHRHDVEAPEQSAQAVYMAYGGQANRSYSSSGPTHSRDVEAPGESAQGVFMGGESYGGQAQSYSHSGKYKPFLIYIYIHTLQ